MADIFSGEQLEIVRFCAVECKMQVSGEESVAWMVNAWNWAFDHQDGIPTVEVVIALGQLVEPIKNKDGFRKVGVRVGWDIKPDWQLVPDQMANLCSYEAVKEYTPAGWFQQYEEVHPFVDGNGRTGQILFNWLNGSLEWPQWAPNFWDDSRRLPGKGAPEDDVC